MQYAICTIHDFIIVCLVPWPLFQKSTVSIVYEYERSKVGGSVVASSPW